MVPNECPTEIEELIEDCLGEEPEERPDMKAVFERLKKAASIPPPGASHPLPTPYPTPTMSREGSFRSDHCSWQFFTFCSLQRFEDSQLCKATLGLAAKPF